MNKSLRFEPVVIPAIARAVILLLVAFGFMRMEDADVESVAAGVGVTYGVLEVLFTAYQRSKVSPTAKTAANVKEALQDAGATPEQQVAAARTVREGTPVVNPELPGPRRG